MILSDEIVIGNNMILNDQIKRVSILLGFQKQYDLKQSNLEGYYVGEGNIKGKKVLKCLEYGLNYGDLVKYNGG